jgi:hypothetical protein
MGGSSPSSPSPTTNTVTQTQTMPAFQQAQVQNNEAISNSLATQPYPTYQAPIIAGLNDTENQGLQNTFNNAYSSFQPYMQAAGNSLAPSYGLAGAATNDTTGQTNNAVNNLTNTAAGINPVAGVTNNVNALSSAAANANPVASTTAGVNNYTNQMETNNPANASYMSSLMSPYVQQSLAPQLLQAGITQAGQQNQINAGAAQAGAFGDARQGAENALQNYYGQQTNAGIEAQGYNTAYNQALGTATTEQGLQNQAAQNQLGLGTLGVNEQNALTNIGQNQLGLGTLGVNEQNALNNLAGTQLNLGTLNQNQDKIAQSEQGININQAQEQAALGLQNQNQNLAAGQAMYNVGDIEQQNTQNALTNAYQQYMNQVNFPYQQLNMQESTVNSSPYNMVNAVTIPSQSTAMQGLNAFTNTAAGLGALTSGAGAAAAVA